MDKLSRNVFDKRIAILYERALKDTIELHVVSDNQIIKTNLSAIVSMMKYTKFEWETKGYFWTIPSLLSPRCPARQEIETCCLY